MKEGNQQNSSANLQSAGNFYQRIANPLERKGKQG
jgi:hypothetical protein